MVQSKKRIARSKTIWFSLLLIVLGVVMDNFASLQNIVPEHLYGISYIAIGIVVALLRFVTTKPL